MYFYIIKIKSKIQISFQNLYRITSIVKIDKSVRRK